MLTSSTRFARVCTDPNSTHVCDGINSFLDDGDPGLSLVGVSLKPVGAVSHLAAAACTGHRVLGGDGAALR